jgi:NADH-quinone oxidoreductase subunit A
MTPQESNINYIPLLMQVAVAAGFVVFTLVVTHILTPRVKTNRKEENFECGIESQGNARFPVSIRYFMTAILFVLFDVEVIFFYPYAVNFKSLGWAGFFEVVLFVGFFLVGFVYIIKKGALKWED